MKFEAIALFLALLTILDFAHSQVQVLNDTNYVEFLASKSMVLVKVFAPWCGHCKKMAPEYEKAALVAKENKKPYILAEIDGTTSTKARAYFGVSGFPTIKLVMNNTIVETYEGARTSEDILEYLDLKAGIGSTQTYVHDLTDATYEKFLAQNKMVLLKLYAPWCGHCKKLAPEFQTAAKQAKRENKEYVFAQIDCTVNPKAHDAFNVSGYPTLKFIMNGAVQDDCKAKRDAESLTEYMEIKAGRRQTSYVVKLTDDTYEAAIQSKNPVLIKLYAPWCGHCKKLAPEYERAAKIAKDLGRTYTLAEIDGTVHTKATTYFEVQGYPTLKLVQNGKIEDYKDERTTEKIIEFMDKKGKTPETELKTEEEVKAIIQPVTKLTSILISDDPKALAEYKETALEVPEYRYYHMTVELGKKVFPNITRVPTVVQLDPNDQEPKYYTSSFCKEDFNLFLLRNEQPTVVSTFTQPMIDNIFSGVGETKTAIFMFRSATDRNADKIDREFKKAAMRFRSEKYLIALTDIKERGHPERIAFYLTVTPKDLPTVQIVRMGDDIYRYIYRGPMTEEKIYEFVKAYEGGKLERFFRSEPVPEVNKGPVYKTVASTFKKDVLSNDTDVVVNFCLPFEKECKDFEKVFDRAAHKLQHIKALKFVTINAALNDVPGHRVKTFPTVKLFLRGTKPTAEIYEGEFSEENFVEYLKQKFSSLIKTHHI